MRYLLATIILPVALAACDTPSPLTLTNDDFNLATVNNNLAGTLPFTPVEAIPAGTATYEGQFTSGALINDQSGYDMIGDVALRSDFGSARPSDVTGTITNVNVIDRNTERDLSQSLAGTLNIDGISGAGTFAADATGELEFVDANVLGIEQEADVNLRLQGDVRSSSAETPGDFVYGIVDGTGTGGFDLELTGNGRFTAVRR